MTMEQSFWDFLYSPLLLIVQPFLRTHLSPPHELCDGPNQAVHYHTLGFMLGASGLIRPLAVSE